jgi:chromate transporter
MLYGAAAHLAWFAALFLGIKAAVLAIVVQAVLRLPVARWARPFAKARRLFPSSRCSCSTRPFRWW